MPYNVRNVIVVSRILVNRGMIIARFSVKILYYIGIDETMRFAARIFKSYTSAVLARILEKTTYSF